MFLTEIVDIVVLLRRNCSPDRENGSFIYLLSEAINRSIDPNGSNQVPVFDGIRNSTLLIGKFCVSGEESGQEL